MRYVPIGLGTVQPEPGRIVFAVVTGSAGSPDAAGIRAVLKDIAANAISSGDTLLHRFGLVSGLNGTERPAVASDGFTTSKTSWDTIVDTYLDNSYFTGTGTIDEVVVEALSNRVNADHLSNPVSGPTYVCWVHNAGSTLSTSQKNSVTSAIANMQSDISTSHEPLCGIQLESASGPAGPTDTGYNTWLGYHSDPDWGNGGFGWVESDSADVPGDVDDNVLGTPNIFTLLTFPSM